MLNLIIIEGRVTHEPKLVTKINEGKEICFANFSIASSRDCDRETTDFIECVCFNCLAENFCKYVKKGDKIKLVGSLQSSSYTNKNGHKRKSYSIRVDRLYYADNKDVTENYTDSVAPISDDGD